MCTKPTRLLDSIATHALMVPTDRSLRSQALPIGVWTNDGAQMMVMMASVAALWLEGPGFNFFSNLVE